MGRSLRRAAQSLATVRVQCVTIARSLVGLLMMLGASGCIGPRSLELTRLRYDQAVHETTEQQWLRNIVRLRYGDLPSFMDVAAITSQFELSSQGGFTGGKLGPGPCSV
jgi:hypothetical protein